MWKWDNSCEKYFDDMIFQEKFRKNMFFHESFLEMCKKGANTGGTLKTFAVLAKMLIIFLNIFAKKFHKLVKTGKRCFRFNECFMKGGYIGII